jgi:hypothetical protein
LILKNLNRSRRTTTAKLRRLTTTSFRRTALVLVNRCLGPCFVHFLVVFLKIHVHRSTWSNVAQFFPCRSPDQYCAGFDPDPRRLPPGLLTPDLVATDNPVSNSHRPFRSRRQSPLSPPCCSGTGTRFCHEALCVPVGFSRRCRLEPVSACRAPHRPTHSL